MANSPPTRTPGERPRFTSSIVLILVGSLFMLCGPAIGALVAAGNALSLALVALDEHVGCTTSATIESDGPETFYVYGLSTPLPSATSCSVQTTDGSITPLSEAPYEQNMSRGPARYESFARFALPAKGTAVVTCSESQAPYLVGPRFKWGAFLSAFLGWPLFWGGALTLGGLGTLIIGIVRFPWQARSRPGGPPAL